mmetsp:Transcript_20733/g.50585  ORF Transcript_20733/g.50585 Transcript_20733/m.50585 type:complete len:212 (-) Transcript_20733:886-1521(-)
MNDTQKHQRAESHRWVPIGWLCPSRRLDPTRTSAANQSRCSLWYTCQSDTTEDPQPISSRPLTHPLGTLPTSSQTHNQPKSGVCPCDTKHQASVCDVASHLRRLAVCHLCAGDGTHKRCSRQDAAPGRTRRCLREKTTADAQTATHGRNQDPTSPAPGHIHSLNSASLSLLRTMMHVTQPATLNHTHSVQRVARSHNRLTTNATRPYGRTD